MAVDIPSPAPQSLSPDASQASTALSNSRKFNLPPSMRDAFDELRETLNGVPKNHRLAATFSKITEILRRPPRDEIARGGIDDLPPNFRAPDYNPGEQPAESKFLKKRLLRTSVDFMNNLDALTEAKLADRKVIQTAEGAAVTKISGENDFAHLTAYTREDRSGTRDIIFLSDAKHPYNDPYVRHTGVIIHDDGRGNTSVEQVLEFNNREVQYTRTDAKGIYQRTTRYDSSIGKWVQTESWFPPRKEGSKTPGMLLSNNIVVTIGDSVIKAPDVATSASARVGVPLSEEFSWVLNVTGPARDGDSPVVDPSGARLTYQYDAATSTYRLVGATDEHIMYDTYAIPTELKNILGNLVVRRADLPDVDQYVFPRRGETLIQMQSSYYIGKTVEEGLAHLPYDWVLPLSAYQREHPPQQIGLPVEGEPAADEEAYGKFADLASRRTKEVNLRDKQGDPDPEGRETLRRDVGELHNAVITQLIKSGVEVRGVTAKSGVTVELDEEVEAGDDQNRRRAVIQKAMEQLGLIGGEESLIDSRSVVQAIKTDSLVQLTWEVDHLSAGSLQSLTKPVHPLSGHGVVLNSSLAVLADVARNPAAYTVINGSCRVTTDRNGVATVDIDGNPTDTNDTFLTIIRKPSEPVTPEI